MSENFSDLNTVFLISGKGSNAEAAIKAEVDGINYVGVIADREETEGEQRAKELGVKTFVIPRKDLSEEEFGNRLHQTLEQLGTDCIMQLGFLSRTPDIITEDKRYKNMILNLHPGDLTGGSADTTLNEVLDFGGENMYGYRPIAAAILHAHLTQKLYPNVAATIHHVAKDYDKGFIVAVSRLAIPESPLGESITIAEFESNNEYVKQLVEFTRTAGNNLSPLEHQMVIETLKSWGAGNIIKGSQRKPNDVVLTKDADIL